MTNALTTVAAANALSADVSYVKSPMSVDDYGVTISRSWRKVVSGILETGRLLLDAQERLTREEFTQLRQRLSDDGVMSNSVISKLMGVASNAVLSAPANLPLLPASYATLYALSRKDENEVQTALSEGKITSQTQLKDVIALFAKASEKGGKTPATANDNAPSDAIIISVAGDLSNVPEEIVEALKVAISAIQDVANVIVKGV